MTYTKAETISEIVSQFSKVLEDATGGVVSLVYSLSTFSSPEEIHLLSEAGRRLSLAYLTFGTTESYPLKLKLLCPADFLASADKSDLYANDWYQQDDRLCVLVATPEGLKRRLKNLAETAFFKTAVSQFL